LPLRLEKGKKRMEREEKQKPWAGFTHTEGGPKEKKRATGMELGGKGEKGGKEKKRAYFTLSTTGKSTTQREEKEGED